MKCPFCEAPATGVVESRIADDGEVIRRRRICGNCSRRFTTYERVNGSALWVVKKDGRREPFSRDKARLGILRAIEKRPVSIEIVDEIVEEIEREMFKKKKQEISSRVIGNAVLRRLRRLDRVAWLRFASVYLQFDNLEDFEKAIVTETGEEGNE